MYTAHARERLAEIFGTEEAKQAVISVLIVADK